ncbi:MAG TPA: tetratricopeptide repeat protein [Bacteroidales bacterium]|nr:tetratricopeptide repeat protein [Bacteroidales bacterium]
MKARLHRLIAIGLLTLLIIPLYGQKGIEDGSKYGHGQDSANCLRNLSLYKTYYDQDNYEMALGFWRQAFNECPASSKNIYINGVRMYKTLFRQTRNRAYIDTLNMVYDARIIYFGEEAEVQGRRGSDLWDIGSEDPEFLRRAHRSLNRGFEADKRRINSQYMIVYMASTQRLFDQEVLSNEEVINIYGELCDELDTRIANSRNPEPLLTAKENIEAIFRSGGAGTCEGLVPYFTPKVAEHPDDPVLLKKVLVLLESARCNDEALYYTAAENLYKYEKSAVAAYHLAEMNSDKKNYEKAEQYYLEAIKLEEDKFKIANYYTKVSSIRLGNKDYKAARDYAKMAIENDPKGGTPYMLVGNVYASIKPFEEDFDNQTVYWVAVDYLNMAKQIDPSLTDMTNETIGQISGFFPTKSECFFRGIIEEGTSYSVGTWINENTVVRFRKE